MTSLFLIPFIHLLFLRLNIDSHTVKRLLNDQLIRRCMLSVVKGINYFGLKFPQPAGAPITVVWNFTNRCNLNCLHCHQDSSGRSPYPEMTTAEAFKVIDNMSDAGVAILTFSGGEPLLREDIYGAICSGCRYTAYITNSDWLGPDASCPFGPTINKNLAKVSARKVYNVTVDTSL